MLEHTYLVRANGQREQEAQLAICEQRTAINGHGRRLPRRDEPRNARICAHITPLQSNWTKVK